MIISLERVNPGDLYTTTGRDIWQVLDVFKEPTIILKNTATGDTLEGPCGHSMFDQFVRLIPEQ